MKKILNKPENFVDEMVEGILYAYPDKIMSLNGDKRVILHLDEFYLSTHLFQNLMKMFWKERKLLRTRRLWKTLKSLQTRKPQRVL